MSERREVLADAAIGVLAVEGLRGLTHRAVDRAAGVAEGTCSYYFRTRAALLAACVERLGARSSADVTRTRPAARTVDDLVEGSLATLRHWTTVERERLLARWELSLEATRRPELRAALVEAGRGVRRGVVATLAALGADEADRRAGDLVAALDGIAFDEVAGAGGPRSAEDLHRAVTTLVHAALPSSALEGLPSTP
jgi:AcrR family transcriptional regulator